MPKGVYDHRVCYKHGQSKSPVYRVWLHMRDRCYNPHHKQWKDYGGRGIKICSRWADFEAFAEDMGLHPGKGWSIERINNDGDYEPHNCQWATRKIQQRNRRTTILTATDIREMRQRYVRGINQLFPGNRRELAEEFGISYGYFHNVITGNMGWADV